ncbi:hypothetical protein [Sphingobium sp. TCM1]|uniref:hypothetical protein n=1 Tax=Sphingobium sp. TCM1 TaxID=453246 RepID=UPI0007F552E5|nr:hypothetical protein [Sphingobium sp. TCM1]OAN56833.1 hypothetical protein A7Q26_18090 [Sphingobium sp. TCM1]
MELREKIVREAFAKKDVKPLLSHLRAISLGSDEIDMLASLLKRGCLPLLQYPDAKGEAAREDAITQIVAIIEARAPIGAADEIKAVLALIKLIETGYRAILEDLAGLPSASLTPQCRISALFDLCAQRRDGVRTASMDAIIVDGMIDPIGLGVANGHGNVVSPDVPIDVDVVTLTMALKMEAFQQGWFNASGQLVLPKRVETTPDEREAVRPLLTAAQAWRHWTWIEEETRYFDGTLTDVAPSEFPQDFHDAGVTRFLHHVPGSAEWHVIDLAANERVHLRIKQEAAQMAFGTNAAKLVKGVSDKTPLLPDAFVSIEELQSAHTLDHALSINVATDTTQYRGLRLVEWLRGYATLQELVAVPYEAGDHRPELLLVEVERADLIKRLQRVGLSGAKADSFISLVSFDKGTRDLFDTPILCIGPTTLLLYGPALVGGIPAQTTLSRLACLKQSLEARGKAFEKAMLAFMRAQGLDAQTITVRRGREEYDYDLLVRWDGRIFLFECKSRSLSGNNLIASYYDALERESQVGQVTRLVDGLKQHPDILDGLFGPGASGLELIPSVLNVLPMSVPDPIDGIYFTDASALTRLFHSPALMMSTARSERNPFFASVPTRRLWAGNTICADDLVRQLQSPVQLNLMLRQIGTTRSMGWLKAGCLAATTRILHQIVPTSTVNAMLGETEEGEPPSADPSEG